MRVETHKNDVTIRPTAHSDVDYVVIRDNYGNVVSIHWHQDDDTICHVHAGDPDFDKLASRMLIKRTDFQPANS